MVESDSEYLEHQSTRIITIMQSLPSSSPIQSQHLEAQKDEGRRRCKAFWYNGRHSAGTDKLTVTYRLGIW